MSPYMHPETVPGYIAVGVRGNVAGTHMALREVSPSMIHAGDRWVDSVEWDEDRQPLYDDDAPLVADVKVEPERVQLVMPSGVEWTLPRWGMGLTWVLCPHENDEDNDDDN